MTKLSRVVHAAFMQVSFHGGVRLSRINQQHLQGENIMKKTGMLLTFALAAGLLAGCATQSTEKLLAEAKVSKADAEKTALAKVPNGTVKSGDLEKEGGKLIWSFDIATPDSKDITEVAVDAVSGAVVDVTRETPAEQEKKGKQ
jgi:uncharacterized membrane protein YkoI